MHVAIYSFVMTLDSDKGYLACLDVSTVSGSNYHARQRKTLRACDACRRRKVGCDGDSAIGSRCTNCVGLGIQECTYATPFLVKKRGSRAYIEDLEIRLANAEKLLNLLCPNIDISYALKFMEKTGSGTVKPSDPRMSSPTRFRPDSPTNELDLDQDSSGDEYNDQRCLDYGETPIFLGKSSELKLIQLAIEARTGGKERSFKWIKKSNLRRYEYWDVQPWTKSPREKRVACTFPDPDLLSSLVGSYFAFSHGMIPLLHQPTFEKAIADGLHLQEVTFASTVLLVCANAVRFSEDPRLNFVSYDDPRSPGWLWFHQSNAMQPHLLQKPSLHVLQSYCLSVMFLVGCSSQYVQWMIAGAGIRLAQEVGAHMKRKYAPKPTVHGELWKRVFWILLMFDRVVSATLGRTCALQEEDFDIGLPIEVDDEYWVTDNPNDSFKQPDGVPSRLSYFIWMIKLHNIRAAAVRRICAIDKFKVHSHKEWNEQMVDRLLVAIKAWNNSLPAHLQWDPDREDIGHYKHSAVLRSQYYQTILLAYKPFINSRKFSALSTHYMAMSTEIAKEFVHMIDAAQDRLGISLRMFTGAIFTCALHLILNRWWPGKDSKATAVMDDVYLCIKLLSGIEKRWYTAGKFCDVLHGLLSPRETQDVLKQHNSNYSVKVRDQKATAAHEKQSKDHVLEPALNTPFMAYLLAGQGTENIFNISDAPSISNHSQNQSSPAITLRCEPNASISIQAGLNPGAENVANASANDPAVLHDEFDFWSKSTSSGEELGEWISYLSDIRDMVKDMQESDDQSRIH